MFSTVYDKEELNLMKWKNRLGYLMTVVSISSVLFMTTGCSHRAVHGMSEKGKAQGSGQLISDPGAFSSSDSAMLMDDGYPLLTEVDLIWLMRHNPVKDCWNKNHSLAKRDWFRS